MIAFSIAPMYALLLGRTGWAFVCGSALAAAVTSGMSMHGAGKVQRTIAYVAHGCISAAGFPILLPKLTIFELAALVVVGVSYLVGATIYAKGFPDPLPHHFGYHEIFHCLIALAASASYAANSSVIGRVQMLNYL